MDADARRELRELAEKATQRDWCVNGQHVEARPGPPVAWCASGFSASAAGCTSIDETEARANAAYIAAAHPSVIIELLDELEKTRAALAEFTGAV